MKWLGMLMVLVWLLWLFGGTGLTMLLAFRSARAAPTFLGDDVIFKPSKTLLVGAFTLMSLPAMLLLVAAEDVWYGGLHTGLLLQLPVALFFVGFAAWGVARYFYQSIRWSTEYLEVRVLIRTRRLPLSALTAVRRTRWRTHQPSGTLGLRQSVCLEFEGHAPVWVSSNLVRAQTLLELAERQLSESGD